MVHVKEMKPESSSSAEEGTAGHHELIPQGKRDTTVTTTQHLSVARNALVSARLGLEGKQGSETRSEARLFTQNLHAHTQRHS